MVGLCAYEQRALKIVYGEVESEHQYQYYDNGVLKYAQITEDDDEVGDLF
jgi:hypothetical protein